MGKHYETNWTREKIFEVARQYKTRSEFKKGYCSAYKIACKSGLIYEMDWFNAKRKTRGYWTKEKVFEVARQCNTKKEFQNRYNGAFQKAHEYGWIDEMDWFEDGNIKKLTDKIDCVYIYHFKETNSVYVGRTICPVDRDWEHRRDKKYGKDNTDTVYRYSKENGFEIPKMEIIEDNLSVIEGQEREGYWVEYYREKGYNILNKAKTGKGCGSIGAIGRGKWNKETVFAEAKKYKTRYEFFKFANGAWCVANKNGWLDEMTWFVSSQKPKGYWTREKIFEEARKYKTKTEFENACGRACCIARENGWLDEMDWFARPIVWNKKWYKENVFEEAKRYQNRKKFQKGSNGAYTVAWKNGWLDELFPKAKCAA